MSLIYIIFHLAISSPSTSKADAAGVADSAKHNYTFDQIIAENASMTRKQITGQARLKRRCLLKRKEKMLKHTAYISNNALLI